MKKQVLLILLVLLPFWVSAQNQKKYPKTIGIKTGINFGSLAPRPDGVAKNGVLAGFSIGIFGRISTPITGFFVQPEIIFNQKGGKLTNNITNNRIQLLNMDIPIIVGKNLFKNHVRIGLGPVFSFVLDAKEEVTLISLGQTSSSKMENINKSLFAYQLGIGFNYKKINLDLRYENTFTQFIIEQNNYRPMMIQITIGYSIL